MYIPRNYFYVTRIYRKKSMRKNWMVVQRNSCLQAPNVWNPVSHALPYELEKIKASVIKWKHYLCYWSFMQEIHRSPVNSPHKGQWRGALMFSLICAWISGWINNNKTGDLRHHGAYYDATVMFCCLQTAVAREVSFTENPKSFSNYK